MNINCITGNQDHLYKHIQQSLHSAKSIDIIVSFLMESGVKLIKEDLEEIKNKNIPIRILTGNYLNITQPSALYLLKDILGDNVDLRFYNDTKRSFHPKAYIFEYDDGGEIFIGSSNLSRSAWTSGLEWNYRIDKNKSSEDFNYYKAMFEDLFNNESIIVNDTELERYSKTWKKPKLYSNSSSKEEAINYVYKEKEGNIVNLFEPRGAQIEALYQLKKSREEGYDKGLVVAATGIGKTYLAAFDSREFNRVLFLAHREEILKQAYESFKNIRKDKIINFRTDEQFGVMVDQVEILLFDEPLANLDPATGKQTIELIEDIQEHTGAAVVIIEHRLEDVLWRSVDRIVLVGQGRILADTTPDALLAGSLLSESGIREPLYLTALKYAGVEITADKKPAHIDTIQLNSDDQKKLREWFLQVTPAKPQKEQEILLEVDDLTFGYNEGETNLEHVSFSIRKGEMLSIVGRNGAGKSTLSKLICGFETPISGHIRINGRDLEGDTIKERAAHIGYVMQNPNQMISKPMIWDEVELGLLQTDMTPEERKQRVEETLKICGLYPFRKWPVSALSFGQKKRVTIASVLVMNPEMIILDEPTAGQDFHHYTDIMEFLRELNKQGVTVVMITHDMHLMQEYTARALVFGHKRLLHDGTAVEALTTPELVQAASLKETSLFTLAQKCGVQPPEAFVQRFIDYDRQVRKHE